MRAPGREGREGGREGGFGGGRIVPRPQEVDNEMSFSAAHSHSRSSVRVRAESRDLKGVERLLTAGSPIMLLRTACSRLAISLQILFAGGRWVGVGGGVV